jgi:polar amino acid transport system substrate-binding protein
MKTLKLIIALFIVSANIGVANSSDVTMAFGEKIPPFCFPETNSGLELEVIGEALAYRGHILIPKYYSFARIPIAFKQGHVDAIMTDLGEDMSAAGGHYGDPAVWYDNVFITLKEKNIKIIKPEDLNGLSVISFQGAVKRYPKWLEPVKKAGKYYEKNNQKLQILTLDRGRYDVVLSDRNIFKYYTIMLKKEEGFSPKPIQEHKFVKLNMMDYRPVFREKRIRDDFNAGLKHLKESGRYQAIYDQYLKE